MGLTAVKSAYLGWLSAALAVDRGSTPQVNSKKRDLIVGYATGYGVSQVALFVHSLRSYYQGPVLLVTDNDPALRAFLEDHNIEAVDPPVSCTGAWSPHAVVSRFAGFDCLLRDRPWVRNALLTDVRDVVFQADPFGDPIKGLEFFSEASEPLSEHAFNMKYLRAVAGEDLARAVSDKACICVGTVMGPREGLMRFCRLILMLGAIPRSEIGGAFGADQACCNLAVHMGLMDGDVKDNHGRVATVGMVKREALGLRDGVVVNPDGSVSAVLHQYDRHPDLMEAIWERWGGGHEIKVRKTPRTAAMWFSRMMQSVRRRSAELR